ncbi:MAG: peptidyl-alpha-hydroxyglycine alpha-amidating lyase family protein [Pirellulaceae bacterium]|jgi:DNA-binding beta-propeller fold protein YncE|nr:peptidyl-alpha-hydroxyglycine alpha-amidating lyase family protein [Pirellulaceae bacterium]MDP7018539.1 peptidyl-alpha-hydroxyglycine alpha-amidating lyase family protein [Pirellulaceae bacterium]
MNARQHELLGQGDLRFRADPDWLQLPADVNFVEAIGVAVDSQDRVFIFNRGDPPIIVVSPAGQFVDAWGDGEFQRPHGVTVVDDTLFLTDDIGHAVHQYSLDGERLRSIGPAGTPAETGVVGFDHRQITAGGPPYNLPTNVAVDAGGEIFVSDGYGNSRIHRFAANGELLRSWGGPGSGRGEFLVPHGVAVDRDGRVFVADRENNRVQIFDGDGEWLTEWTDVVRPCDFAILDDLVYIAELGNQNGLFPWQSRPATPTGGRVSIYNLDGQLLSRWGGGLDARRVDGFYACHDIAVDATGNVYVGEVAITAATNAGEPTAGLPTLRKFDRVAS